MAEFRKCPKYDWAWCDGVCENCTTTASSKTIQINPMPVSTTRVVDISTESINMIAEAVVEKLRYCGTKMEPIPASPENGLEVEE